MKAQYCKKGVLVVNPQTAPSRQWTLQKQLNRLVLPFPLPIVFLKMFMSR